MKESSSSNSSKSFFLALRELMPDENAFLAAKATDASFDVQYLNEDVPTLEKVNPVQAIDLDKLYSKSYEDAFDQVVAFGELELDNGKKLADQLKGADGKSLWYYFRFMTLYQFRVLLYEERLVLALKAFQSKYETIHVAHSSGSLDRLLKKSGFKSHYVSHKKKTALRANVFRFLLMTTIRFLLGLFQLPRLFRNYRHVLLVNAQPSQKIIEKQSFHEVWGDHFTEYLQYAMQGKKDFLAITEFFPPNLKSEKKIPIKKETLWTRHSGAINLEAVLYLQLLNPWFYRRCMRNWKQTKRAFEGISIKTPSTEERILLSILPAFKRMSYFLSIRKAALQWLFARKNYQSIGGANEHDPRVKSILETAKACHIQTYGIQHGVIHPKHMHYYFSQEDVLRSPYPDLTFLWGAHWGSFLTNASNYHPDHLAVVGQIRTDIIPDLVAVKKADLIPSLSSDKKTVLYPSQPLYEGEGEMRKRLATDFLQLSRDFPHLQFVIKPHPKETDCETFMKMVADKVGTSNYQVLRGDLYKTLAAADLVVVYNSTVGAEAIYFSKPLLVMNYSNNDFSGFIASGVGDKVENYAQLKSNVQKLAEGSLESNQAKQKEFLSQRAYLIDGKVSERILKALEEMDHQK